MAVPAGVPSTLIRFADMSNSGGSWGPDGNLYLTGAPSWPPAARTRSSCPTRDLRASRPDWDDRRDNPRRGNRFCP